MIIQYIFLVSDLKSIKKGALIAQACHASVKAIHKFRYTPDTIEYLKDIDHMTKIIIKIKYKEIKIVLEHLKELDLVEWIEHPENIITCISLRPYKIESLEAYISFIRKFKLY